MMVYRKDQVMQKQWRSQTFSDGRAHYFYKILYKHAGSYVHLLKGVVCMKMHTNSSKANVKAWSV